MLYKANHTAKLIIKPVNTKLSIKAKASIVVLNKLSRSSGFRDTAKLNDANKIPTPKAENATGNIRNENVINFPTVIINMANIYYYFFKI